MHYYYILMISCTHVIIRNINWMMTLNSLLQWLQLFYLLDLVEISCTTAFELELSCKEPASGGDV
jgi:hypothetical protein